MLFMCYRCRAQRFQLVRMEVDVQPDREDAERDDAAVEVAAHFFCEPFARLPPLRERCLSPLFARLAPRALAVAAVVKTWCAVAFGPK